MTLFTRKNLTSAGVLVMAMMLANFLNFVFNAFLGRHLSYEEFGILTFFNTAISLIVIFYAGLSSTVNHRTAYLNGKYGHEAGSLFTKFVRRRSVVASLVIAGLWLLAVPAVSGLFHIDDKIGIMLFSPVFVFASIALVNRGYLQGNLLFMSVAIMVLAEALIKLLSGAALVFLHLEHWVYLSIPASLLAACVISVLLTSRKIGEAEGQNQFRFPKRFYTAAVVTGLSSALFMSVDVIMAKHYLDPAMAGEYSLLSLVGKMVFFFGSLLNGFIITFVSHDTGERKNPRKTFMRLFAACLALTSVGVIGLGLLGHVSVPILLGDKAASILQYLPLYTLAVGIFTIVSSVVTYHLARRHYSFSAASLAVTGALALGLMMEHDTILDFTQVILFASVLAAVVIGLLHALQSNGRFVLANLVDLFNVFLPLEKQAPLKDGGKRILIMNWRDTKHKFSGGAEVYIHELAKRWVQDGSQVTLFCGNDGKSRRNETIDGVRVIRRGGFYFVYPWAFLYYVAKFRNRFDLIIDCQNGIPFFTPLYAKEKVYSLIFHVHQKVFYKFLPKPLAWFAAVLENRAMPYAYRKIRFLTISESTKREMVALDLVGAGIDVIFPGVDLDKMHPGEKDAAPSILYLGRLKAYKSVDVLVNAFRKVVNHVQDARLIIAGSGEEEKNLRRLAGELGLTGNIDFLGFVPESKKVELMQRAWVFVNPSMMEGWGITTIEANACGTPVVAADVPGLRDSVNNPHTGYLVPHGNQDALAERLLELIQDDTTREEMALNAIDWSQQFNWERSARKGLALIYAK